MSRRTSEASKAIRAAWIREQELVSEGKGTRDWTPEQQKEIHGQSIRKHMVEITEIRQMGTMIQSQRLHETLAITSMNRVK